MNRHYTAQRAQEIFDELNTKNISLARVKELNTELEELNTAAKTLQAAQSWAGADSPAQYGRHNSNPGDHDNIAFKGFAPGMENQIRPTSMYELDTAQIGALKQAAQQGTSFRVKVGERGIEHGHLGGIRSKAPLTEGGLTPNLLPPVQQVGPLGFWTMPYELTRVANHLVNVAFESAGVAYFRHDSNGLEAGHTPEGAPKNDLTPVVTEHFIRPAKVAGRINLTHEIVQDAGDAFTANLVSDLARSVYNAESNLLLNGTAAGVGFDGINQVSGTLTRAADIGTTDIDALDTLSKAFVDLRSDYFVPDCVFCHPATLGSLRRLRDKNDRLQLELLQGAGAINQTSEQETLWGVKVVQTTQQAPGTAAVLSVQSGAAVVYVREGLSTFYDPYSQAANNIYQYIAETRIALATPRPGAICLVSGLPVS